MDTEKQNLKNIIDAQRDVISSLQEQNNLLIDCLKMLGHDFSQQSIPISHSMFSEHLGGVNG